ncbi:2-oxoglutarate dehydrogenase, E2 component, dihydrolipoamide succinyltransferase [Streptomonospora wellingtoniae]|uniref:Dihydrolipoamide acetyltransferase component of pyruvate dehydrogenase complex n=1 Tax=Streptomonospora wellingtoniae TaxID=3075544 RepID=A0ABU2KP37_9ACTN|nr:2-oxoglutarate dehydrogenase, E2 component, dihydrolipoamide succinyltransferase [Streptomonospora sp. DSM 45055]MDT0301023.1 2-oxoglutarate dehydrogenase, E2 component, dihydrolipoamide succinyltransferase [Streptomonospora sp. DSM 45055]
MPELGESVTEGTVTQWLKQEGDRVEVDEPLLEVSTDKVDTEIPSPAAGVLTKVLVAEDETVEIGAEIAIIGGEDEAGGESAPAAEESAPSPEPQAAEAAPEPAPQPEPEPEPAPQPAAQPEPEAKPQAAPEPVRRAPEPAAQRPSREDVTPPVDVETVSGSGRSAGTDAVTEAYVTPLVRKLATEEGVDLSTVQGTGVGGRIRKQDVQDAARKRREAPAGGTAPQAPARTRRPVVADTRLRGTTETMSRLRQTIADQMAESLRISAEVTQVIEVDVTTVARLRERAAAEFEQREGVELGFFPFIALAAVESLKAHPKLNAVIDSSSYEVTYHSIENLGISVDTEPGLLVPVIKDAGDLNLGGIARKIADLSERAHTGSLSPDELSGGTFTLADTGEVGALFNTPIINQPQVGILSTGAVVKRPVVVDDPELGEVIAVRSMMYVALTHDHRLIDSADAARFLQDIRERIEEGAFESEVGLA